MSGAARRDARSRYAALNINPPNQRGQNDSRTGSRRGNMQSLGKISGRRMPAPAQLKSLKSENEGNDPTINLVPQGGGGWRNSHKEEEEEVEPKKEEEPRRQRWNNPPPQPQPRAGPENFRSDFPSLEEHEKMTKKERDELQQRQLEEAERSEQRRERSHSPYHDFPKHPDGGPWRGQGYPSHSSRRGGGQGPMRGNHSYYRMGTHPDQPPYPSHHQPPHGGYPPMPYRQHPSPYYNKNPYEISPNPYKMPPGERKWETGENRPPTVRSDDIDNMDEEGDVGWAGHYEEVDYSKEVVFEDSSDEDSPKEEKKGRTNSGRQRGEKVNQSPKALRQPKEKPKEQPQPSCWKPIPSQPAIDLSKNEPADLQEEINAHSSLHSPPPHGYPPSDQFYHYNRPPLHSRHDHWISHPYASPPYSRGPMKHRRGSWEHEERDRGRSLFQPHWDASEADGQNRHRSSMDRPKIVMAKHPERENRVLTPTSPSERLAKEEKDSSHVEPTAAPQSRMPPKKIMIRNLSERSNEDASEHASPKEARDASHTPTGGDKPFKSVPSSTSVSSPVPTESNEGDSTRTKVAWDSKDRGPITSQKTLYEPEGKKSEAKFHNYQRMATETISGVGGGKLLRVSSSGSAKGEQTSESPKNSSAGILGEAPMAAELLEKVQFHGRVQRRPNADHSSPLSPTVQQQLISRRDTDSGRPPRRSEHDRREHSKGRRRDSHDLAPEERKVSQRKQKSQPREEQTEGGRGRRRGDVETRQRQREVEKRDGQKEREVSGLQDSSKKQESLVNKVSREKPHESNERGEGRRTRPGSQSYQERERVSNSEKHDQRTHDGERSRDRNRDRRRAPDSDWSKDKNWNNKSREGDLPQERRDDSSKGQPTADKPRERNRDQRTRDKHADSFRDPDSVKERDVRRGRQDQKRLQEDTRTSHQQPQSTDRLQSSVSSGSVVDGNRHKHKSELATTKPSAEYKDLPNRVVQELPTDEDLDKKVERAPVSRDHEKDRERDRRRDRPRPRGEERRRRGQPHASQQEHQVSERKPPRQGQKSEANDHGTKRQARERRDETGEAGDDSSRQQPSGIREPERSGRGRGRGRGRSGPRLESASNFPKDNVKVYDQLEDIESASDWENDETTCLSEETGEAKKGEFSSSEHSRRLRREERQRPGSGGGDKDWKRPRIGRGRGRGQPSSERQEHPSSNRRRDQRHDTKTDTYSRSQGASSSMRFGDIDEIEAKQNRRNTASSQEIKRAEDIPHKGQDISRFDVNSQGVVVVDEEGYDEEASLVSGESDGFQVVRTKREKQKDKEEKKKMEEKERRKDRDHHYRSHSLLPSGSVSQHGSNLPLNKPAADQSATWGALPDLSDPSKPLWTEYELPLSLPSNFGAVGEKFQKDQFHKPSSIPQPGSTLSDKDQSYQLFSPQTYPLGPPVTPRTGDMLMAAVDQSVRIPFSASQVPKEKPASLSEILENEGVSGEDNVKERVRDNGSTQKQTSHGSHSGQQKGNVKRKATDDRFYIPPHTRQDTTRGSRRHPSSSIRSSKSSTTKSQTKVTGLADAHLEETGACDDHVTEPGRLQQCQRAGGGAEAHLLEVCQDATEQCHNGHCKVTQQVAHIGKGNHSCAELNTQKQAMETRSQCNVERISGGVELDIVSKSKSYASALMSVPKGVGLSSVVTSSSCSSTTSTHGNNSPVPLDSSLPGEDGEGDENESVEEKRAVATQPDENEGTGCAPGHEDREIDDCIAGNESLSQEMILPPSPSETQCQSSTLQANSPPTGLSNFSPTDSSKGVHQAIPLAPKLSSLSSPRIGTDDQSYADSTLLRSTSALGVAPDTLASHFSSSSPPNSLPDVTSPFIKVRLSSALTRTSSAPCPLPQAASDRRARSPVSPLSKMSTTISSVDQPDSEPGKVPQREEEVEGEPDDRSDSSISKSSSLSIMADEFVPKYGIAAANINQYAPRVQPSPITTVGSVQHQSWPKSNFSHPPPPPPQHQQQSLLNQPSFPTQIQLHVLAAAQLQIQQQLAAASANDQRVSNIPTQRVFHQIPVPIPQLSHPVSPQQPPPPVLHPTLPMAVHHCPPLQVQNMAIRHSAMTMASKPNFPPSMLQYGDKEREKAVPLGSVMIQQQIQQQHHRQQKSLKPLPAAQPSAPMHQRHPQQLTLLPTAPPHHHPIQLPLQAQSQLSSSLVLGRQHSLAQLGLQQNLALLSQATVSNPVDVIRRQPSSRPPLLPTPPDFTLITARTTTTPGAHPPVVNSTISPPITWPPPQVRISATHDSSLAPLPLNPPISLPN